MPILGIMASQISGHLWAPEGAYDSLATVTLSASAASIDFVGIPSGYKHLQIRYLSRSSRTATTDSFSIRFNSDTASNYARHYLYGDGASASAGASTSQTSANIGTQAAASASANIFGVGVIDVLDYTSSNKNKTIRCLSGTDQNGSGDIQLTSGLYFATPAAITSITLLAQGGSANFVANSTFALYGIK
jgi:hypothetical protein